MAISRFSTSSVAQGLPKYQNFENLYIPPVAGYTLWLDASVASSFTFSSGTSVSQWSDLSGNGYNFTQSTSTNQPVRNTNVQKGRAGVYGTTNDVLSNLSLNWSNSAFTVFLVVKTNNYGGFYGWFGAHTGTGSIALGTASSTGEYSCFRAGVSTNPSNLVASTANPDVAVWKSSGMSGGAINATIYRNGTQSSTNPGFTGGTVGSIATLFSSTTGLTDPSSGYLYEVLLYPSQLSDPDRNKVESYLKVKWGTP